MITLLNLIVIGMVLWIVIYLIHNSRIFKKIITRINGYLTNNFVNKTTINDLIGRKNEMNNIRRKMEENYVEISGEISVLEDSIKKDENKISTIINEYNKKLEELKKGENISKVNMKMEKDTINREIETLNKKKERFKILADKKDSLKSEINMFETKINYINSIIENVETKEKYKSNKNNHDYDISLDEINSLLTEAKNLYVRKTGEDEAAEDLYSNFYKNDVNDNEKDISINDLELNQ